MTATTTNKKLKELHNLLLQEWKYAKSLAVENMLAIAKEKQKIVRFLDLPKEVSTEDRIVIEAIRTDNINNTYLFWSTLTRIRESMDFLGKQAAVSSYNVRGNTISGVSNGGLLSGMV